MKPARARRARGHRLPPARTGIAALLGVVLAAASPPPQPDEIVVTASRSRCRYRLASHALSDHELNERAKLWSMGTPVRVVTPAAADRKCLVKIAFKLARRGVRVIEFVDPEEDR